MARGKKATTDGDGGGGKSIKTKKGSNKQVSETDEATVEEEITVDETEQGEEEEEEEDEEEAEETWDLVRLILQDGVGEKTNKNKAEDDGGGAAAGGSNKFCCRTDGCTNEARVVWANNLNPNDEWPLCLACQEKDFDGFPDDLSLPPDYYDNDRPFHSAATGSSTTSDTDASGNKNKAKGNMKVDDSKDDKDCDSGEEEEEEEEQWDVKKIMSIHDVTNCPVLCSTEGCNLPAAVVLVSNLKPTEKWYSCIPCQVRSGQTRFSVGA